ncbi:MAG: radical SAM protein [Desulfobacteraceae bacterium]|nr:MAG: radical SAM protein [Desulfobacteraceae bacterium]
MASKSNDTFLTALAADRKGRIFELDGYSAVGMSGDTRVVLSGNTTRPIPYGSELMFLPGRSPIAYNIAEKRFETLTENPNRPGEPVFPVAAFNSPGYVLTHVSAYREESEAGPLPLFAYGAVGCRNGNFRTAVLLVDREKRQDLRQMKREKVLSGIREMQKRMPKNRLRKHLETCALAYGCPAAKNFFLGRYEAPLPSARSCNARCLGCLSLQKGSGIPASQHRIDFSPTSDEIAEVALAHIERVKNGVVSFGQGCEGDPLTAVDTLEPAVRRIRTETRQGTINMNTNGSRTDAVRRMIDAGLDSLRISMNSCRPVCYHRYFGPVDYTFTDVEKSVALALDRGIFVSLNYLNCPGFTDTPAERDSLVSFLSNHPIHMIQWRNLNYDPVKYWRLMKTEPSGGEPMGMAALLKHIEERFPELIFGYFNPPKERFKKI